MKFWPLLLLAILIAPAHAAKHPSADETPDFALLDYTGREYRLHRTPAKVVVLFFSANGCPVAEQSFEKLVKLQKQFDREGVEFWLVDSNTADDRETLAKQVQRFKLLTLPLLQDETQGVAAMLGVKRTATAVAIETKNWTVIYRGALDDQLSEGATKPGATENYLRAALEEFVAGKKITTSDTPAHGCIISFDKEPISYAAQVAPVLQNKCFTCHSPGNIGSFAMTNYTRVKAMSDMIQEVVLNRRMPPWQPDRLHGSFEHDSNLTVAEARTLLRWIEQGAQRGEGEDPLATAVAVHQDWPLGEPDALISLPKAEEIAATGIFDYRHIKVKIPFTEDVWVRGVAVRPDNRRVVHHIIVRVREPGQREDNPDDAFLVGWAPGSPDMFFPTNTGKRIKKGSTLDFEMHYTASGKPETDQSKIAVYLTKEKPQLVLKTRAAYNFQLDVPPGASREMATATYVFKRDSMLYDLSPHMHLRGSWFKFEALYPTGEKETLLSVPRYDFNWQHNYRLKEPKRMPAGTWILCTGGYDNSAKNPHNPDPNIHIHWGDQSFDEMFIGFMGIAELPKEKSLSAE
jgi:peroxiredoxin